MSRRIVNKKAFGTALSWFATFLLAIIFLGGSSFIAAKAWGAFFGSDGSEVLSKLKNEVEIVSSSQYLNTESKSALIKLEEGSAVYGFTKNALEIKRTTKDENLEESCTEDTNCRAFLEREEGCPLGQSCICVCTGYTLSEKINGKSKMHCEENAICTLADAELWDLYQSKHLSTVSPNAISHPGSEQLISGGFIISRVRTTPVVSKGGVLAEGVLINPNAGVRLVEIQLQNKDNRVVVCRNGPCINKVTEEIKKKGQRKTNTKEAIQTFSDLTTFLSLCQKQGSCQGPPTRFFTTDFNVYYLPSTKGEDRGIYLVSTLEEEIDLERDVVSNEDDEVVTHKIKLFKDTNRELEEGPFFKFNKATFLLEGEKIIVTN